MQKTKRSPAAAFLMRLIRSNVLYLVLITIILAVLAEFLTGHKYFNFQNFRMLVFIPMVVPGVMLVAVGPLLIGGAIDLSTASQASLSSVVFATAIQFMQNSSSLSIPQLWQWIIALVLTLCVGAVFGLINIFFTNVLNFLPFISTIGMASIYTGFGNWWTNVNDVAINNESFARFGSIAYFKLLPILFIFMIALVLIYSYILVYTRFGRSAYMCGGNPQAARLAGLNPKKIRASLFINSGVIAALGGVVWSAQRKIGNSRAITTGAPNMLALTALILGGTSFYGGTGGVSSGLFGLLLVVVFDSGMQMFATQSSFGTYVNTTIKGFILIIALMMDGVKVARARRALTAAAIKGHEQRRSDAAEA